MKPKEEQWNVVQLSEVRARKASQFGPVQKGLVKPKQSAEDEAWRKYSDEAIALGNSGRNAN